MPDAKAKVIDGIAFQITQPYAEGQTINAAEAKALNQVRSENIGNNLRETVKKAKEDGTTDGLAAIVADYDQKYVFSLSTVSTSARRVDPIEREAMNLAREFVKAHLDKTGRKIGTPPEGVSKEDWKAKIDAKIEEVAANEQILKEAEKNVKARAKQADTLQNALGSLDD